MVEPPAAETALKTTGWKIEAPKTPHGKVSVNADGFNWKLAASGIPTAMTACWQAAPHPISPLAAIPPDVTDHYVNL